MMAVWYDKQGNWSEIGGGGDQHAAVSVTHEPPSGRNLQYRPAPVPKGDQAQPLLPSVSRGMMTPKEERVKSVL